MKLFDSRLQEKRKEATCTVNRIRSLRLRSGQGNVLRHALFSVQKRSADRPVRTRHVMRERQARSENDCMRMADIQVILDGIDKRNLNAVYREKRIQLCEYYSIVRKHAVLHDDSHFLGMTYKRLLRIWRASKSNNGHGAFLLGNCDRTASA